MKEYGNAAFDRRQYPRLDFSLPLAFQTVNSQTPPPPGGLTGNVSYGGLMAYLPHAVNRGETLEITLLLPVGEGKQVFKARAEAVWVENGMFEGGWTCRVGLKFFDLPPEVLAVWRGFLSSWGSGSEA